jgi:hypothetical protein
VSTLARALVARGNDVAVATLAPGTESSDGVAVYRVGGVAQGIDALHTTERRHAPPVPDPGTRSDLKRLIAEFRPDIVHAHNWLGRSFVPLKRRSGARFVVTLHDCGRVCAQGRLMFRGEVPCDGLPLPLCLVHGRCWTLGATRLSRNQGVGRGWAADAYIAVVAPSPR